jgi:dTDP-glucose 4,6-dehydratase/UDP-glucuronate decarboxylase
MEGLEMINLSPAFDQNLVKDARDVLSNLGELIKNFAGSKVLLTGAAGFLGSQFLHFFALLNDSNELGKKCNIFAMDNFLRGKPAWLQPFTNREDIKILDADIISAKFTEEYDYIIHAASIASPTFYRKFPIETMDANVIGLRNLLDHAVRYRPKSVLFFSSSEIYGDPDPFNIPTKETYRGLVSCTGPRACYDESKRYGETLCVMFHQVHNIPVKIVRPFNNYGPGLPLHDKRVLPDFFRDVLNGHDISMLSDGKATRTFCYISDAITGYLQALLSPYDGESFNIGSDSPEISMRDLADLVIKISGKNLNVITTKSHDPNYLTDNPNRRCPDLTKSKELLNYIPKVSLENGLTRMLSYYLSISGQI